MAVPVVLGIMAVTAIATAYAAYKKGEISKEEYERNKQLGQEMEAKLKAPPGMAEPFTPEEYAFAQKYNPQIAAYVEENRPELVTESGSQTEKRMQRNALSKYSNLAETGTDVIADAQREEALFDADAQDKARRNQIVQNMANRGLGGSGQDMLAQMQSSQDSAVNARSASLDAVKQAEARRLGALDKMAGLAGNVRGQNFQVEQNNANVMNAFNQRLSSSKNQYNQNAADTQNRAQQFNIENEQRVNAANTGLRNQSNLSNLTREEDAKQRLLDFQNNMATGNYDRAADLNAMKSRNDREGVADKAQVLTSTAAAGANAYSSERTADAADRAANQRDEDLKLRREDQANRNAPALNLYSDKPTVYNDTNKTRSRYA